MDNELARKSTARQGRLFTSIINHNDYKGKC
jgi:hypothetical protein